MQQLELFGKEYEASRRLDVETVAISTDDLDAARSLKNNKDGIKFPMPMLADPKLELFKLYHAFDDFENQPLHGDVPDRRPGKRPVPANLGRPFPRCRVHQGRGRADQSDFQTMMLCELRGTGAIAMPCNTDCDNDRKLLRSNPRTAAAGPASLCSGRAAAHSV